MPALSERCLSGAVAAFQALAKDLHAASGKPVTVHNPWQSPARLCSQWQASFGRDPLAGLAEEARGTVRLGFARRNILEHNGGRADEKYLRESGDTIATGRPVRYGPDFVRAFIAALRLFANALEATDN